jgi:hypothetical protein
VDATVAGDSVDDPTPVVVEVTLVVAAVVAVAALAWEVGVDVAVALFGGAVAFNAVDTDVAVV